ncbi:MAG: hypothetical protein H6735_27790, partial [Alphaproteobacteria bacterium]|nr:hypothetical protein [Alphaproteobacteria bacterium]
VAKREVPWSEVVVDPERIAFDAGGVSLRPDRATGTIADLSWDLALSGGLPPLFHLPHVWMYEAGFPKKKALTPAPNLVFDGELRVAGEVWPVARWVGLRGHNWGTEHAHTYAYGSCNLWDDGDPDRTVDGFTVKVKLGGRPSPWLTVVVGRRPEIRRNRLRHWLGAGEVSTDAWVVRWPGVHRRRASLEMRCDPSTYAGLRYLHPDGRESYCYNTKFADVRWSVGSETWTSRCGELEVLVPEPLPQIPLHPTPGWDGREGDYRSE